MCGWHNYEKWGEGTKAAEAHRYLATAGAGLAEPATTRIYQCDLPACAQAPAAAVAITERATQARVPRSAIMY